MTRAQAESRRAEFHHGLVAFRGPIEEQRQYNLEYQADHFFWSASSPFLRTFRYSSKRGRRYDVSVIMFEIDNLSYQRAKAEEAINRAFKPLYRALRNRGYIQ